MKYLVIDIETSMSPHNSPWDSEAYLCSIGLENVDNQKTWLFNHTVEPIRDHKIMVKEIQHLINLHDLLVFHNAKFDLAWLRKAGIKYDHKQVWCTMIADYVLFGQNKNIKLSLNSCTQRRNIPGKFDLMAQYWQEGINTDEIPWDVHDQYLRQDCRCTRMLYEMQVEQIKKAKLTTFVEVSGEVSKILAEMEYNGIKFNKERAVKLVDEFKEQVVELDRKLCEKAGVHFSPSSSVQLGSVLYGGALKKDVQEIVAKQRKDGTFRVSLRWTKMVTNFVGLGFRPHATAFSKKTGRYSTGKQALLMIGLETDEQRDFLALIDERKVICKSISTLFNSDEDKGWINKVQSDGRIHPTFNLAATATGRLSSSNPNGQNLPRSGTSPLKELFESELGAIVNVDLSQIEWRMAAALSEDPVMCKEIRDGLDCHTENGERFFGLKRDHPDFKKKARQPCKVFNFRMIYNGTANSFFNDGTMPRYPLKFWKETVDSFWGKYNVLRKWQLSNEKTINRHKYLRNKTGRILTFKYNQDPDEGPIGFNFNAICNYPVQSVSADLMFVAMIEIVNKVKADKLKAKPVLAVHDSFVWDCAKEDVQSLLATSLGVFKDLPNLCEKYYGWRPNVPLEGEGSIGVNYGKLGKEIKLEDCTQQAVDKLLNDLI